MFRRDEQVVVLASPDAPGLVGKRGQIANSYPPADGRWQVAGLREQSVDEWLGFPTFTADQLRPA
jgi:hypothetical protein